MKKKLFSVLAVLWLTFFGFTNADYQLIESVSCTYNRCEWQQRIDININWYDKIKIDTNNCTDWQYWTLKVKYDWKQQFLTCWNLPKILENIKTFSIWSDSNSRDITNTYQIYWYVPPIVEWGTEVFSGVLTSVSSSVSEFIPYIVYIWIWILTASIWFVSIKWLLNRLKSKVLNPFRK